MKLTDDADVSAVIAIGEGIETALSIRELPDLGSMPVWSVLSAGGITAFPVLPGIESVWIAADNDAWGPGRKPLNQRPSGSTRRTSKPSSSHRPKPVPTSMTR